ncbi:aldehyde dehydrogenase family protein [Streptomyces sp. W16]|nr:aldehyde dehydrogenase family protein [Streptomyces sp. W16]MDV9170069.1 aldehyde dehydrogenase family protein [Streptomyces sp. W16]
MPERGLYVQPTVLTDVKPDMQVAREEIFGPVLVTMPFDTEDEAVTLANATEYGLAGAVWCGDAARGMALAHRIEALYEYTQLKTVSVTLPDHCTR